MDNFNSDRVKEELLHEGLTVCWRCGKAVKGKVVFRNKGQLSYLIYECPRDGIYEHLLDKGKFSGIKTEKLPSFWPYWEAKPGMPWDDSVVINRKNLPILVFIATTNCNSTCKICSYYETKNTPPVLMDIKFLKEKISSYRGKDVILCGGEVTTREDLPELIEIIKKSGNNPVIYTNGLKLANREYVRLLRRSGLRYVRFSFDGFDEEICEQIRGGRYQYNLKLSALENLVKEKIRISLAAVIVKGINESQIKELIRFAAKTRNIIEITFIGLNLVPAAVENKFTQDNVFSLEEIRKMISDSLLIQAEEFFLWDEFKMSLSFYFDNLKSLLPFQSFPIFHKGCIYLKRNRNDCFLPLLKSDELKILISALKNNNHVYLFSFFVTKVLKILLRSHFRFHLSEDLLYYRENIIKIVGLPSFDTIFSPIPLTSFGFYDSTIDTGSAVKLNNEIYHK